PADNDGDLGHNGIADRVYQLRTAAYDSALFCVATYHESGNILEKDDGQACLITVHDKARCLICAIGINDATHLNSLLFGPDLQTLVSNDSHWASVNARVGGYDCLTIVGLIFVHRAFVHDCGQ